MGKGRNTIRAAKSQTDKAPDPETRQSHLGDRYVQHHTPERLYPRDENEREK